MSDIRYWQLASGDDTRDFSQVCLDFGIACLGPGNPGQITTETIEVYKNYRDGNEWKKIKPITQVAAGDRIVLRRGQRVIQAVGEVIIYNDSVYNFSDCFNDVDGWDLQHFVKVKWKPIKKEYEKNVMTRSTMERLWNEEVIRDIVKAWSVHDFIRDKYPTYWYRSAACSEKDGYCVI